MSLPYRHPARAGSAVPNASSARIGAQPVAVFLLAAGAWVGGVLTLFQR